MKDNFSNNSAAYAQFRPTYPDGVFAFLHTVLPGKQCAWDCATGTGQVAEKLVKLFDHIEATDLSENQLKNAVSHPKIRYSQQVAEQTDFSDQHFDCITVGQAVHWFDFEKFYAEAKRVLKPNGLIVVLGYGNIQIDNPGVQKAVTKLYAEILGDYWDPERRYIDEAYQTIPFPFEEILHPEFAIEHTWKRDQLLGYLSTWSAVKHFKEKHKMNPIDLILPEFPEFEQVKVTFPVLLRIGK
ncbi:class I SAM-dependent methyltransferase [Fluviicola chungangensis]|uniref:Class I SAM-dependent methyltransferase n=1 Tax=Fluviicola chungangensis TaxID=2597671 RepID=A0A556MZX3_9FLAO|nr:class I SAM-dependent methyltransferase [Fluviicola chungangensis]TSJ45472.1 class I SAM-dependent methyltransferase [Fluviicola chungangensis]